MARYLVVAHQTASSPELVERVQALVCSDPAAEFVLLVPATPIQHLPGWVQGEATEVARSRADDAKARLEDSGARIVRTCVVDASPLRAIDEELRENPADYAAIIICTLPIGISRWLRMDLPHRAERKFSLPIVHVVAEPTAAPAISDPFSFDTILVPLDGILSELVLGPVSFLARGLGSRVTLVHVSEKGLDDPNAGGDPEVVGQRAAADRIAERYLDRGAATLRREGVAVDTLVLTGKADRAIVDWAREGNYGLVAMATYSRGGGARTEPGHVTTQVLHACPVPLLLSCPGNGDVWAAPCHISRLLVPLDGSPLAEEALPYAAQLALQLALPLTLIQVISASRQPVAAISEPAVNNIEPRPIWRQSFSAHPLLVESQLDVSTTSYLSGVCQKLAGRGIVTAWHAPWGAPPDAILEQVRQDDGTLVVMASHGGSGPERASVGSVTSAVIRAARAPILTVPPRRGSPCQ